MGSRWDRDRFAADATDEVTLDGGTNPVLSGRVRALAEGKWSKAHAYLTKAGERNWPDGFPLDVAGLYALSLMPGVTLRVEPPEDTFTIGETAEGWIVYDLGEPLALCLDEEAAEALKARLLHRDPYRPERDRDDDTFDLF